MAVPGKRPIRFGHAPESGFSFCLCYHEYSQLREDSIDQRNTLIVMKKGESRPISRFYSVSVFTPSLAVVLLPSTCPGAGGVSEKACC